MTLRCSVFDIRSLTWDEWSFPEGVILPIVTLWTIRPEDSGVSALNCTGKSQVSVRLGMSGGISPRHTHHALSPHPHIIICTSFISSIAYNVFIILQFKRPFVPKSDVMQRFTTTTCIFFYTQCNLDCN